jgi:hypothetical protein
MPQENSLSRPLRCPKSARKNRSGDAGGIFCAQLRRCVACSKDYVNPGTATLNADLFGDEEAGVRLLNREGKNPKIVL